MFLSIRLQFREGCSLLLNPCLSKASWPLDAGGHAVAVTYRLHKRSAGQGNVASLLAMGDAYFYGQGVEQHWGRAAAIYYEVKLPSQVFSRSYHFAQGMPWPLSFARKCLSP